MLHKLRTAPFLFFSLTLVIISGKDDPLGNGSYSLQPLKTSGEGVLRNIRIPLELKARGLWDLWGVCHRMMTQGSGKHSPGWPSGGGGAQRTVLVGGVRGSNWLANPLYGIHLAWIWQTEIFFPYLCLLFFFWIWCWVHINSFFFLKKKSWNKIPITTRTTGINSRIFAQPNPE